MEEHAGIVIQKKSVANFEWGALLKIGLILVAAFATGGTELLGMFYPCGIACAAVAIKKSKIGIYLLPFILGGIGLQIWHGADAFGDVISIISVSIIFFIFHKKHFEEWQRALICSLVTMICNVLYYIAANILYRFEVELLLSEAALVAITYFLFNEASKVLSKKEDVNIEVTISAICGIAILSGYGMFSGGLLDVAVIIGFIMVAITGYCFGISSGISTAAISALTIYACGEADVGRMYAFLATGVIMGLFKGLNRYPAAMIFSAVCMLLGELLNPLVAAIVFAIIPSVILRRIKSKYSNSSIIHDDCLKMLERNRDTYSLLARLYGAENGSRGIVAHQFKGMEQIADKLIKEVRNCENGILEATRVAKYRSRSAVSTYASKDSISGDSYSCSYLKDGRYLYILSDGMGKGANASAESRLAVTTLKNLVESGVEIETALKTLNSILLLKSEEMFCTLDICVLDECSGRMKIYKIGAEPTFIRRKDDVKSIRTAALPMGIIDNLHINSESIKVREGDLIVMVSDGVTNSILGCEKTNGTGDWLKKILKEINSRDVQTVSDLIINKATENYGGREKDDLTVISILIE